MEARGGGELVEERDDVSTSHVGFFGVLCVPLGVRLGWGGIVVVLESVWVEEELRR